ARRTGHGRDSRRRARAPARPQLVPVARPAYAARSVHAADRTLEGNSSATTVLSAARLLNGEGGMSASPAWIAFAGGRIVATGAGTPDDAIDLGDALLAPGYLDLQVNGFGAVDFASDSVDEIVDAVDAMGATGALLTICSSPLDAYDVVLRR